METPTIKDFARLESKVEEMINLLKQSLLMHNLTKIQTNILSVKDVKEEYNQSPYLQRLARKEGTLPFILNSKEIQYSRKDVEIWIESKIIR